MHTTNAMVCHNQSFSMDIVHIQTLLMINNIIYKTYTNDNSESECEMLLLLSTDDKDKHSKNKDEPHVL